jgi:hypothetical protein
MCSQEHFQAQKFEHAQAQAVSIENTCTTFELVVMNILEHTTEEVLPTVGTRHFKNRNLSPDVMDIGLYIICFKFIIDVILYNRCYRYWLGNLKQMLSILVRQHMIECP